MRIELKGMALSSMVVELKNAIKEYKGINSKAEMLTLYSSRKVSLGASKQSVEPIMAIAQKDKREIF